MEQIDPSLRAFHSFNSSFTVFFYFHDRRTQAPELSSNANTHKSALWERTAQDARRKTPANLATVNFRALGLHFYSIEITASRSGDCSNCRRTKEILENGILHIIDFEDALDCHHRRSFTHLVLMVVGVVS